MALNLLTYMNQSWNVAKKLEILQKTWNIAKKLEILQKKFQQVRITCTKNGLDEALWYLGIFFTQFKELETNLLDKLIIWNYKSERLLKRSIFWFRAELGNIFPYATWWNKMFTSSWHRSTSQFQPWDNHCNSNKWQTHN